MLFWVVWLLTAVVFSLSSSFCLYDGAPFSASRPLENGMACVVSSTCYLCFVLLCCVQRIAGGPLESILSRHHVHPRPSSSIPKFIWSSIRDTC